MALFTLLPNRNRPTDRRQISIISFDSDSVYREELEKRDLRLNCNANRATQRENEATLQ